jgi:uncharacterized protein with HEPN domain
MPSKRAERALFDIRDNVLLARKFTAGLTAETFKADQLRFYAVARCLEIVSEAARRLHASVRARHPTLPWRSIMDLGNFYRHEYDNVAEDYVWRTAQQSLAPLLAAVEDEISRLSDKP